MVLKALSNRSATAFVSPWYGTVGRSVMPLLASHTRQSFERYSPPWSVLSALTFFEVMFSKAAVRCCGISRAPLLLRIALVMANREKSSIDVVTHCSPLTLSTGSGPQMSECTSSQTADVLIQVRVAW